jgi:hypothetical protein
MQQAGELPAPFTEHPLTDIEVHAVLPTLEGAGRIQSKSAPENSIGNRLACFGAFGQALL